MARSDRQSAIAQRNVRAPNRSFPTDALRCLPVITPDYRDTVEALVRKDMLLQFDGDRLLRAASLRRRKRWGVGWGLEKLRRNSRRL